MRYYFIVFVAILLFGCTEDIGYHEAEYKDVVEVVAQPFGQPLETGVPVDLCQEGGFIFVLAYTPDNWLHIYDKLTGEKISDCIRTGRGPGEGINIVMMNYDKATKKLYLFDMAGRKTLVCNLDGRNGIASFEREIIHPSGGVIRKCHILPGERFLYEGYIAPEDDSHIRYTLFDGETSIDTFSDYPGIEEDGDRYAFVLGISKSDSSSGKFVAGTTFGSVLECFDLSEDKIRPTGVRLLEKPRMSISGPAIKAKDGTKYGFSYFCLANDLVYAVFIDDTDPNNFNSIVTFNWRGKELTKYVVNHNILRICQGDEKHSFYAIISSPEMVFSLAKMTLN